MTNALFLRLSRTTTFILPYILQNCKKKWEKLEILALLPSALSSGRQHGIADRVWFCYNEPLCHHEPSLELP